MTESGTQLAKIVEGLRKERQQHVDAIEKLDAVFEQYGISAEPRKRRSPRTGRPAGKKKVRKTAAKKKVARSAKKVAKKAGKKKAGEKASKKTTKKKAARKKFKVTGEQSVLNFVKKQDTATTAQINAQWRKERRGGNVGNILTNFVKDGTFKRESIKGERGSVYRAG